jgi:monoamine oxidase
MAAAAAPGAAEFDVVIVGAGICGLRAASLLCARGDTSVAVLEARDRVGGRLLSLPREGGTVDLGATWHWPNERRVIALLRDLGIGSFPHSDTGDALWDAAGGPERLEDGAGGMAGARRFVGGSQTLAAGLAARLPPGVLRLETACSGVSQQEDGSLVVATSRGALRARRAVVLALPPALSAVLTIQPPLPPRLAAAAAGTPTFMGSCAKTVVVYDRPFWRDAGLSGAAFSRRGPLSEVHDHSGTGAAPVAALLGFSAAPGAPSRADVLAQLVRLFGPAAGAPLELLSLDWSSEAHTAPAKMPPGAGGRSAATDAVFAAGAWGGCLQLCSAETATAAGGPHIEGALAAAERATAAVAALAG